MTIEELSAKRKHLLKEIKTISERISTLEEFKINNFVVQENDIFKRKQESKYYIKINKVDDSNIYYTRVYENDGCFTFSFDIKLTIRELYVFYEKVENPETFNSIITSFQKLFKENLI